MIDRGGEPCYNFLVAVAGQLELQKPFFLSLPPSLKLREPRQATD